MRGSTSERVMSALGRQNVHRVHRRRVEDIGVDTTAIVLPARRR
jgi:hypothetical protein